MIHGNPLNKARAVMGYGRRFFGAAFVSSLIVVACDTGAEPLDPASVNLSFSVPVAASLLDRVDRVHIRITSQTGSAALLDTTFTTTSAAGPFTIEVPVEKNTEEVTALLELFGGGALLFGGETSTTLQTGQVASVNLQAQPVPGGVTVKKDLPTFQSLGDTVVVNGVVTLATGDTIPGLTPTFSTSSTSVAKIVAGDRLVSTGEGSALLIATYEQRADTAEIVVDAVVVGVSINPGAVQIPLGTTRTLNAAAQDANGNPLERSAQWSSNKPTVATVDDAGTVTPVGLGSATISVEIEGYPALATVDVAPGPATATAKTPDPIGTRVATLRGSVNPNGAGTTAEFEWSTNAGFTTSTKSSGVAVPSGTTPKDVAFAIKGLTPSTTYYVRLRTTNSAGEATSEAISFETREPTGGFLEGRATVEGESLSGARVTLNTGASTVTDAAGKYTFEDVALGTYTITISDLPADVTFSTASQTATISTVGQVVTTNFSGEFIRTSVITGTVSASGDAVSGVSVSLSGPDAGATVTDGAGQYTFSNLRSGSYSVSIAGFDPDSVAFSSVSTQTSLGIGQTKVLNFSGVDLGTQNLSVYAFIGIDGSKPGVSALSGVTVELYPTASAASARTGRLDVATTNSGGRADFVFERGDDTDESGGKTDNTVYSVVTGLPAGNYGIQADSTMTITYGSTDINATANDTIDVLNGNVTVVFRLQTIATSYSGPGGSAMLKPGWTTSVYTDTTGSSVGGYTTGLDGKAVHALSVPVSSLPVTYYLRANDNQPPAASNTWTQTPEPQSGASAAGRFIRYVHDGTGPQSGTLDVGRQRLRYLTQSMFVPVHHEVDNTQSTPLWSGGDNFDGATAIRITVSGGGVTRNKFAASNGDVVWNGEFNSETVYTVSATSTNSSITIVSPTSYTVGQPGGGSVGAFGAGAGGFRHSARVCPLSADTAIANCSAFAYKYNNTGVTGNIQDGSAANVSGLTVELYSYACGACARSGSPVSTVTTNGSGNFTFSGLLEGIYEIVPVPASGGFSSATVVAPSTAIVTTAGNGNSQTSNWTVN